MSIIIGQGDICTRQCLLTTQSQLFLVTKLEPSKKSVRTIPLSSSQKAGYDLQVQTDKEDFWACEMMELSMPIDSLYVTEIKLTPESKEELREKVMKPTQILAKASTPRPTHGQQEVIVPKSQNKKPTQKSPNRPRHKNAAKAPQEQQKSLSWYKQRTGSIFGSQRGNFRYCMIIDNVSPKKVVVAPIFEHFVPDTTCYKIMSGNNSFWVCPEYMTTISESSLLEFDSYYPQIGKKIYRELLLEHNNKAKKFPPTKDAYKAHPSVYCKNGGFVDTWNMTHPYVGGRVNPR